MAKTRGQGEGSFRKRPNGTWEARYSIGKDDNGKQIQKSVYGKTKKEVQEKLNAILHSINNETYIEPSKMTLGEWLTIWLNEYKKISIKPTTFTNYRLRVENYLKPELGNIIIKDLTSIQVQKMITKLAKKKLSAEFIRGIYMSLHAALNQAIQNDMIIRNVADTVTLPKIIRTKTEILTTKEQEKFIEIAKGHYLGELFILDLGTGLRLGEILALKWDEIDLDKNTLTVSSTLTIIKDFDDPEAKWHKEFGTPKTATSNRKIPLIPSVIKILESQKQYQAELSQELKEVFDNEHNLVFTTQIGKPLDPRNMQRTFKSILDKANIGRKKIHCLRHTFASRGLEKGIDMKVMQELLGHNWTLVSKLRKGKTLAEISSKVFHFF